MNRYRHLALAAALALPLGFLAPPASAYSAYPLRVKMTSAGPNAAARFVVTTNENEAVDISIETLRVTADIDGKRTFTPNAGAIVAFPPQFSLTGDKAQSISVRYVGDPAVKTGAIYAVRVEQTNVSQSIASDAASISIRQNFIVTVVVDPPGAKPSVRMVDKPTFGPEGARVIIANDGPGVADLTALAWTVTAKGARTRIANDKLAFGEMRFVAPGEKRVVRIAGVTSGDDLAFQAE